MSRLTELIEELCPDGVEYRRLGEIADLQRGSGMPKKLFIDEGIPAIHYGHIFTKYGIHTKCAAAYLAPEDADKLTRVYPGDLVVANTSENLEDVGKGVVWLGDVEGVTGGHATVVRSLAVDTVFLSYYLRTEDFALKKRKYAQGTKVIELSAANLSKIDIPVPPLEVQREIVRILDQFTTLEAELEAELEARRTQYEHYRNHLLSYESLAARGQVEMVKLGDVIAISRGASPRPISKYVTQGEGIPWIKIGDVDPRGKFVTSAAECITSAGAEKSRKVLPGDFILSNSMSFGRPYILQIEGCVHDGWLILSNVADHWIPDFLYHSLRTDNVQHQFAQLASGGTVRNLNSRVIESVELPLPPKAVQEEIVSILDRFDALVNDITSGLPAVIAARRAQYEHYRDRLLSFPEKVVSVSDAS